MHDDCSHFLNKEKFINGPDFTVINGGEYPSDPLTEEVTS